MQNEKYEQRILVEHKDKKVERSLKIIKKAKYEKEGDPRYNERINRQLLNDLTVLKQKIVCNSINKVMDFSLDKNQVESDKIYIITEAQNGIPLFEWILQSAGKNPFTENQAALIMREVF